MARYSRLALLTWSLVGTAHAAPVLRAAVPLKQAPASRTASEVVESVCARLPVPCAADSTSLWLTKAGRAGPQYLIDASRPMLVALDPADPRHVESARQWDFSTFVHSVPSEGTSSLEPLEIYPALYPVGQHDFAVAVLGTLNDSFAGGGASYRAADFVTLEATPRRLFAAVPFDCSKGLRGCFSEKEYRTSPHCSDDYQGHLTIRYGAAGIQSFVWHEHDWPANVKSTRQTWTSAPFRADPQRTELRAIPGVSYCAIATSWPDNL